MPPLAASSGKALRLRNQPGRRRRANSRARPASRSGLHPPSMNRGGRSMSPRGTILGQPRVGAGGLLGGSQWGSAADNQRIYVAISDVILHNVVVPSAKGAAAPAERRIALDSKKGGGLHALNLKSGAIVWSARP